MSQWFEVRRVIWIVASLAAAGCAQKIVIADDAGQRDAGSSTIDSGAVRDAGPRDATPDDGGFERDGGPRDGGPRDAGVDTPHTWGVATLPTPTGAVNTIWGSSNTEIYLGTSSSQLLRADGSGWQEIWREPSNFNIVAIDGVGTKLAVASESSLYVFDRSPFMLRDTVRLPMIRSIRAIAAVEETSIFIAATLTNGRGLYEWDGTTFQTINEPTNVSTLESLYIRGPGQPLYIGGNGKMFRFQSATWFEETVEWPPAWSTADIANFTFEAIAEIGDRLYAVGSGQMVFQRQTNGVWQIVHDSPDDGDFMALAGMPNGAYIVGEPNGGRPILSLKAGTFVAVPFMQNAVLQTIWRVDADNFLAGGFVSNSIDGVLVRGTR